MQEHSAVFAYWEISHIFLSSADLFYNHDSLSLPG